jgi:hypothetical protein
MTYWKGIKCRKAHHLTWRTPKEGDVDKEERQVAPNYFILVKKRDCPHIGTEMRGVGEWEREVTIIDPEADEVRQHGKLSYGATWYGYGEWRWNPNRHGWAWSRKSNAHDYCSGYFTVPFYAVRDGLVWQGTIKHHPQNAHDDLLTKHGIKVDDEGQWHLLK